MLWGQGLLPMVGLELGLILQPLLEWAVRHSRALTGLQAAVLPVKAPALGIWKAPDRVPDWETVRRLWRGIHP